MTFSEDLVGAQGAQFVISRLQSTRSVIAKLQLNNNQLGDDGVSTLFAFLRSEPASRHQISEIHLNSNEISCRGLRSIADYIVGNEALKILWLANNKLGPEHDILASFAIKISQSRLKFLSLTGNQIGDDGIKTLFRHLGTPHLQELHINTIGLSAQSASGLAEWISNKIPGYSGGARFLHILKCSGNSLGMNGLLKVIRAIQMDNWSLVTVELYANQITGAEIRDDNSFSHTIQLPSAEVEMSWKEALRDVLLRNTHMRRQIEKEALNLLKYSRILIFRSRSRLLSSDQPASSHSEGKSFPFHSLPMELRLQILATIAPSLSIAQRTRIYDYAADPLTLPPILPPLRRGTGHGCVADPSQPLGASVGFALHNSGGCAEGRCMGMGNSLVCRREEERFKFLAAVGCCTYEPGRNSNTTEDPH